MEELGRKEEDIDHLRERLERLSLNENVQQKNEGNKNALCHNNGEIPTSAHTLLSCVHGRDRRYLRQIGKRDLQAAVKYGVMEEAHPHPRTGERRLKFKFADVVYITDVTGRVEVTSWAEPIEINEAYVTPADVVAHKTLCEEIKKDPSLMTSHSVFVVDQSGSMKTHDVEHYRTRSDAVFGTIALDYVGKQIDTKQVKNTDCATLVLMRDTSEVVIDREPMNNVFFNKLLHQMKQTPSHHGNYIPALSKVKTLLEHDKNNPNCAVMLFFLSDGRPSDYNYSSRTQTDTFNRKIEFEIAQIAGALGNRLIFGAIGFASNSEQFGVLKHMVSCFSQHKCKASFKHAKGDDQSLSVAVSTLSSSLIQSKTTLTELAGKSEHTLRDVDREDLDFQNMSMLSEYWKIYSSHSDISSIYVERLDKRVWGEKEKSWVSVDENNLPAGIAIRKKYFSEGNERIVRFLYEVEKQGTTYGPRSGKWVAKECKYVEQSRLRLKFHEVFCKTQLKAKKIAEGFNNTISQQKKRHPYMQLARITFLDCFVYAITFDGNKKGFLVEKYLDHTKYKKWNTNAGYVDGGDATFVMRLNPEVKKNVSLDAIAEEEFSDDDISDYELDPCDEIALSTRKYKITVDDYPQAFSHFSYRYTKRKMIVCDLQGVLDSAQKPPLYELTDPVIHYSSKRQGEYRGKKFGRTDLGARGVNMFFDTHKCNDLCRLLGLDRA